MSLILVSLGFASNITSVLVAGLASFVGFFSLGVGPICWLFAAEILPTRLRARGMIIACSLNRLTSAFVAMSFLSLRDALSDPGAFGMFACLAFVSFVFTWLYVPETKGKTLEEMEGYFQTIYNNSSSSGTTMRGRTQSQARAGGKHVKLRNSEEEELDSNVTIASHLAESIHVRFHDNSVNDVELEEISLGAADQPSVAETHTSSHEHEHDDFKLGRTDDDNV